jgi:hypothetical protein
MAFCATMQAIAMGPGWAHRIGLGWAATQYKNNDDNTGGLVS